MVSSFPKMQKSSASFSQSIRNRLRLKNLQAQAKNFCRVLDIRVPEIVKADMPQAVLIQQLRKSRGEIVRGNQRSHLVHADVVQIPLVIALAAYAPVFVLLLFVR